LSLSTAGDARFGKTVTAEEEAECEKVSLSILGKGDRQTQLSEPLVSSVVSEHWPHAVFLGAGMACRDFNTFGSLGDPRQVSINRGMNGIDGLIASAAGASDGRPLLLILGDCSCLYDLSSFAFVKNFPLLRIVVISNDDGGLLAHVAESMSVSAVQGVASTRPLTVCS
jgi:2-succinyl-5-enolpyruvyl-6-hydroxy-3-cyclohexene-1-carboxylate synthase